MDKNELNDLIAKQGNDVHTGNRTVDMSMPQHLSEETELSEAKGGRQTLMGAIEGWMIQQVIDPIAKVLKKSTRSGSYSIQRAATGLRFATGKGTARGDVPVEWLVSTGYHKGEVDVRVKVEVAGKPKIQQEWSLGINDEPARVASAVSKIVRDL